MNVARGLFLPVCLIVLWGAGVQISGVSSDTIVSPEEVVRSLWKLTVDGSLSARTAQTLTSAGLGLLIGALLGLVGGIALGLAPRAASVLQAPVELLRPMPSVALIPLSMMAFGFGVKMESAIVAFAIFWPVLILSQSAIAGVDRGLLEVATVLRLNAWSRVTKIVIPAALPRLIVALRLAIGLALVVAVTVEIVANPQGLGYGLVTSQTAMRPGEMLAYLFWVGLLGWGLSAALAVAERRLLARLGVARIVAEDTE